MKHHIMLALGILLGLVFAVRLAVAILQPGLGFREVYLAGGLVLSAWLMLSVSWKCLFSTSSRP